MSNRQSNKHNTLFFFSKKPPFQGRLLIFLLRGDLRSILPEGFFEFEKYFQNVTSSYSVKAFTILKMFIFEPVDNCLHSPKSSDSLAHISSGQEPVSY